jgi:imipenem/basic amino acid-specific outer membrane pore
MKNLKNMYLTLLAISIMGININATTLQEALINGKINGEIRSLTELGSHTDATPHITSGTSDVNVSAIALQLNYESADFNGFKTQVGFQSGHDFKIGDDTKEVDPRVTVEGTNLYLANLSYAAAKTEIKAGRQLITTPLVAGSNVQPLRDSFQAISLINKDIPNTTIEAYAFNEWYTRYTAQNGNSSAVHFDKPSYTLYLKNNSIEGLTVEGQYLKVNLEDTQSNNDAPFKVIGAYSTYYTAFDYKLPISFPLSFGVFKAGASFDSGANNTDFYGVKLGTKIGNTAVKLAYTSVSDDNSFPGALGHVPQFFKYNGGQMYTYNIYAGTDATSILLIPDFGISGLKTLFSYSYYTNSTATFSMYDKASELQADLTYKVNKPLSIRWQGALISSNNTGDDKWAVSRLYLNYKF